MSAMSVSTASKKTPARPAAPKAPVAKDRPLVAAAPLPKDVFSSPTKFNKVSLHVSTEDSKQALLDSIKNAKSSFYIETFIWHDDAVGREIVDALGKRKREAEAKGEKFDVKVLIDYTGLRGSAGGLSDTAILDRFKQYGIEVRQFSPGLIDWQDLKIAPITHRKLYIQDGTQFITGGRNIGNEYLNPTYQLANGSSETSWNDMLYTVAGEATGPVLDQFFQNWQRAGGSVPKRKPLVIPALKDGGATIQTVTTDPIGGGKGIRDAHTRLIAGAKKEIVAIYPYFSDDTLIKQLIDAKKKNPKLSVKVIMPAAKEESHEGSIYATLDRETAKQLLDAGIEVRMFSGGQIDGKDVTRFSHMKGMLVDGKYLSIGSANADARTYNDNHELNTIIADPKTVSDYVAQVVKPNWDQAKPISLADLAADSLWTKIKRKALELVDNWL